MNELTSKILSIGDHNQALKNSISSQTKSIKPINTLNSPKFYVSPGNNREMICKILRKLNFAECALSTENVDFRWVGSMRLMSNNYGDLVNHVIGESTFTAKLNLYHAIKSLERVRALAKIQLPETIPETFMLDSKRDRDRLVRISTDHDYWIIKPSNGSRGVGISLINSRRELLNLIKSVEDDQIKRFFFKPQQRLVQRYLTNTLLLNGHKFDIRAYMLIASTTPLIVFHHPGYARLSLNKYSNLDTNIITHLTNQCIQMKDGNYEYEKEGTSWSMEKLNQFVNENYKEDKNLPEDWVLRTLPKIQKQIILRVIESVRPRLTRKVGCFGLYGCDFIIDESFHVWLLEINMGPALITNTNVLKEVIPNVVEDSINLFEKVEKGKERKGR